MYVETLQIQRCVECYRCWVSGSGVGLLDRLAEKGGRIREVNWDENLVDSLISVNLEGDRVGGKADKFWRGVSWYCWNVCLLQLSSVLALYGIAEKTAEGADKVDIFFGEVVRKIVFREGQTQNSAVDIYELLWNGYLYKSFGCFREYFLRKLDASWALILIQIGFYKTCEWRRELGDWYFN